MSQGSPRKPRLLYQAVLLAFSLSALPLSADPGSDYKAGVEAEKAGHYEEALKDYESAKQGLAGWSIVDRQMGSCLARLGRNEEALKALDRYLEQKSDDKAASELRDRLKMTLLPPAPDSSGAPAPAGPGEVIQPAPASAVDGVSVFLKDNPRDKQHYQITIENLTSLIVGLDFAYYYNRHHDFGLGFLGLSANNGSGNLFHPRYRYHRARFYWDSFFEVGGLFGGYKEDRGNGDYSQLSVTGGDLGLGVDYKSEGPWTFNFLLSFNFVGAGTKVRSTTTESSYYSTYTYDPYCGCYDYQYVSGPTTTRVEETSSGVFVAYPLIGMSYGFIF